MSQIEMFTLADTAVSFILPPQLLKWVGNKQRFAPEIAKIIPDYSRYFEPFVGTGAVLGALNPRIAVAGDTLKPLIDLWRTLQQKPEDLVGEYARMWHASEKDRQGVYEDIRSKFNREPDPFSLLFLSRSCYGGVVRFTKDGKISTPIGPHNLIPPESFRRRAFLWRDRVKNARFLHADFEETMALAKSGDVIYCDPPYVFCQSILYGSQAFSLKRLWGVIEQCLARDVKVLLSIDGSKKSGKVQLDLDIPDGLFKRHLMVRCGRSMLRRFQKKGQTLEGEFVEDRLLLSW